MYSAFKAINTTRRRIRSYVPKYHNDGTGRDFYVNGVCLKDPRGTDSSFFSIKKRSESAYESHCRATHYQSDGQGRDTYIKSDDGGFTHSLGPNSEERFRMSLRTWKAPVRYPLRIEGN